MSSPVLRKITVFLALGVVLVAGARSARPAAKAGKTLLLFDPDANHQAIVRTTVLFNEYLQRYDPELRFQPVQQKKAFDKALTDGASGFAVVASSYLRGSQRHLRPLLVPVRRGNTNYRKIVVTDSSAKVTSLRGKTLAAAALSQGEVTKLLRGAKLDADKAIIMLVSKDIDALLALSFGQVQAALVTEASFELVQRTNPNLAARLRIEHETPGILRAPLCLVGTNADSATRDALIAAFRAMKTDPVGRKLAEVLRLDDWVQYVPSPAATP